MKYQQKLLNNIHPHMLWRSISVIGFTAFCVPNAPASVDQNLTEQQVAEIATKLHPVSDEDWQQIAGQKTEEKYTVAQGDTLWSISKRLFGENQYWPKIWALNNDQIGNPHIIFPGTLIAFYSGSGSELPRVAIGATNSTDTEPPIEQTERVTTHIPPTEGASDEWRRLPQQSWEKSAIPLPKTVDRTGFDRTSKVIWKQSDLRVRLPAVPKSEEEAFLGEIVGSSSTAEFLSTGQDVFIRGDEKIEVGRTYTVSQTPKKIAKINANRTGFAYPLLGTVRIVGHRGGLFVGIITECGSPIPRRASIMPFVDRVVELQPVAGESAIEATLLLDRTESTEETSQFQFVYIDRGSRDGIIEGNVFRAYRYKDPVTGKTLLDQNYLVSGDVILLRVSEDFSIGLVKRGVSTLLDGTKMTRITASESLKKPQWWLDEAASSAEGAGSFSPVESAPRPSEISADPVAPTDSTVPPQGDVPNEAPLDPPLDNSTIPPPGSPSDSTSSNDIPGESIPSGSNNLDSEALPPSQLIPAEPIPTDANGNSVLPSEPPVTN